MSSVIEYQIIVQHRLDIPSVTTGDPKEIHTNPMVVMSLLNENQRLDRLVKVTVNGSFAGYQSYPAGKRARKEDIA